MKKGKTLMEVFGDANPVGRPKGSCKPVSERRGASTVRVWPKVAENIKLLPKGHLRKLLESLYL